MRLISDSSIRPSALAALIMAFRMSSECCSSSARSASVWGSRYAGGEPWPWKVPLFLSALYAMRPSIATAPPPMPPLMAPPSPLREPMSAPASAPIPPTARFWLPPTSRLAWFSMFPILLEEERLNPDWSTDPRRFPMFIGLSYSP